MFIDITEDILKQMKNVTKHQKKYVAKDHKKRKGSPVGVDYSFTFLQTDSKSGVSYGPFYHADQADSDSDNDNEFDMSPTISLQNIKSEKGRHNYGS